MMSLFQSFDIMFSFFPTLVFAACLIILFCSSFFKISMLNMNLEGFYGGFLHFFSYLKSNGLSKVSLMSLFMLMNLVLFLNLFSIFSYNFPLTSQVSVVFLMSFSFWMSFNLFYLFNNLKGMLAHCVPEGTPIYLTWFLFIIEIISNIIRPLTLTVRLTANIVAGHLLLILLSKLVLDASLFIAPLYLVLNSVEIFVALIQSYIYTVMLALYFSELE